MTAAIIIALFVIGIIVIVFSWCLCYVAQMADEHIEKLRESESDQN